MPELEEKNTNKKEKKKASQKQVVILIVVLIVLVVFVVIQFLIRPMLSTIEEDEIQVQELNDKYDGLLLQSQEYNKNLIAYNSANNHFVTEKEKLFDIMDTDTVAKKITPKIKEIGFEVSSLNITDLNAFFVDTSGVLTNQTMKYYEVLEYSEVEPTEEETIPVETMETAADDGDITYGEAKEQLEGNEAVAETEPVIYNTGEYYYGLSYSLTGSYAEIVKLVKEISKNVAMSIESLSFQSVAGETSEIEGDYTVSVVINVYMYEDPSTGIDDISELETDENGNPIEPQTDENGNPVEPQTDESGNPVEAAAAQSKEGATSESEG